MRFKMKQVGLAVGAMLGGLSVLPTAQAVHVSPDGLGQALIFPYFTTRANWNTLINITNTSAETVVAKVRFHEGYNSRDVFDFTVILSPYDVWNGTLSNGTGNVPIFSSLDTSCTVPAIPAGGVSFANGVLSYTGSSATDGGPTTVERLREGYITVLMEGTQVPASTCGATAASANFAKCASHVAATRTPVNCGALRSIFALQKPGSVDSYPIANLRADFPNYALTPLKGAFSLVNADNGWNASGNAVALANFFAPPGPLGNANLITAQLPPSAVANVYTDSFHEPELSSANTQGSYVDTAGAQQVGASAPASKGVGGADGVSWALSRATVVNQWARLAASTSNPWTVMSDWVIAFPTKRFYVDQGLPASATLPAGNRNNQFSGRAAGRLGLPNNPSYPAADVLLAAQPPFTQLFTTGQSCDPISYNVFDREEQFVPGTPIFSPAPAGSGLCTESNIITFDSSNVLGSASGLTSNVADLADSSGRAMANGWMRLNFNTAGGAAGAGGQVWPAGHLPAIGFSIINRTDPAGTLNESFLVEHAYIR